MDDISHRYRRLSSTAAAVCIHFPHNEYISDVFNVSISFRFNSIFSSFLLSQAHFIYIQLHRQYTYITFTVKSCIKLASIQKTKKYYEKKNKMWKIRMDTRATYFFISSLSVQLKRKRQPYCNRHLKMSVLIVSFDYLSSISIKYNSIIYLKGRDTRTYREIHT